MGPQMILNQVTLSVRHMAEAVDFYLTMGFTQIVDTPHYSRFQCPDGGATFSLSLDESVNEVRNDAVIYFEHKGLDSLVATLKQRGIKFDQDPRDEAYLWREAILHDPSGNKIKLYWAGENRLNPPWRVENRRESPV